MPERTWTYPSVSEPGVTRTVRLVDGVLVCDCPARHRCKHIDPAEADLGFDFTAPDPVSSDDRVEAPRPGFTPAHGAPGARRWASRAASPSARRRTTSQPRSMMGCAGA